MHIKFNKLEPRGLKLKVESWSLEETEPHQSKPLNHEIQNEIGPKPNQIITLETKPNGLFIFEPINC